MHLNSNRVNLVLESTSSASEFTHKQQTTSCLTQLTTDGDMSVEPDAVLGFEDGSSTSKSELFSHMKKNSNITVSMTYSACIQNDVRNDEAMLMAQLHSLSSLCFQLWLSLSLLNCLILNNFRETHLTNS